MSLAQLFRTGSLRDLLSTGEADSELQESRIRFLERNVGLPTRAVVIVSLLYYLFFTNWEAALPGREDALTFVRGLFLVYMVLNIGLGSLLMGISQVPFTLIRWLVFIMGLIDTLFLSALMLISGGYDSVIYWVLLALVVRNAFSIPMAVPQILLNLLVTLCYVGAGWRDIVLTAREVDAGLYEPLPDTWLAFTIRILVLLILAVCCFGAQIQLDRQRRKEDEAREFALRQEQLRTAGRLAAEIAHQIKNPLGIINNAAFTLQRNVKEGKGTITQQIQIIREEVARSDRILTELMGYAKLIEGKVERLNLTEELDHAIDRVFPAAVRFDGEIHRDYALGLPPLLLQRNNLSEILVNVLQNAREAISGHAVIHVSAKLSPEHTIVVTISDNGPGIAPELREKIFEPYYTAKEKGTGLGLAIVKHNLEMYGGKVRVESELGKGARFILEFPARAVLRLRS